MPRRGLGDALVAPSTKGAVVVRRTLGGAALAACTLIVCTAVLLLFRAHLSSATAALVLVVPVLAGVTAGGFGVGVGAAVLGFLTYDWFFIRPYDTLTVGAAQNWVALVVYLAVVLMVARLFEVQQRARGVAAAREQAARRLLVVSEHLISDRPLDELLSLVARTVQATFSTRWTAVLLPVDGTLELAGSAGTFLDADRVAAIGAAGTPQLLALAGAATHDAAGDDVSRIALSSLHRPVGQLVVAGAKLDDFDRSMLGAFANQAALAIERSQLQAQALRTELLEEADRWRSALLGAVSHDLRTPLSAIKAAIGTLREPTAVLSAQDHEVLLETVELECDLLTGLVANLLDMARLETGTLQLRNEPHAVVDVVAQGVLAARSATGDHELVVELDDELPLVDVDLVLIGQVLANLLTNAAQHSPEGSTITIAARRDGNGAVVSVSDEGPGVPEAERGRIFHMLDRNAGSGRAGLGLAISSAFVGAHGARLSVADAPGGGASFRFRLAASSIEAPS
jgi:two-component system sensor histidine kinase KdpD